MLNLLVSSEPIDLLPDAVITIDEESPLFEKDSIPGGFSYPFNLPITKKNRRLLEFADRIERKDTGRTEVDFQLFDDGRLIQSGTLVVSEVADGFNANLEVANGNLASLIKDKKLKDLDLGGTRTWAWKTEYKYPGDDFALFPIYNEKFSDYIVDPVYRDQHFRLNSFENGAFYNYNVNYIVICPFPFVTYLLKSIFSEYGYQVIENVFETDPDLKDLILYHTWDITVWENSFELQDVLIGIDQYGDEILQQMWVATSVRKQDEWNLADCMPDMLISDFLLSLRNLFNLVIEIDSSNRVRIVKRQDVLEDPVAIDITILVSGDPAITYPELADGYKLTWEHDETDDIFKDHWNDIEEVLDYLGDPVANTGVLGALQPIQNEIRYVISLERYYRYTFDEDKNYWTWTEYSIGYQNYLVGNREEEFLSKFSTLRMVTYQRFTGGPYIRCPWTEQQGNGISASVKTVFSPRLLFYRGLQENSEGDLEPMGSSDNMDRTGNVLEGKSLCLKWEGEYGIFEQLWAKYMHWYQNRKMVTYMITDPTGLDFTTKYSIDGKHYLLKKRTINLSMNGILPGECEFYQV